MQRLRIVIPLLLSSLGVPALGETANCSLAATTSPRCEAEHARAFAAARNAEINASLAVVKAERARLAASTSHCSRFNYAPTLCQAEQARELALSLTHCKAPEFDHPALPRRDGARVCGCTQCRDRSFACRRPERSRPGTRPYALQDRGFNHAALRGRAGTRVRRCPQRGGRSLDGGREGRARALLRRRAQRRDHCLPS